MNIEAEIASLLQMAMPLRALADDDLNKGPLTAIVDEINVLRAKQAGELHPVIAAVEEGADHDPEAEQLMAEIAKQPAALPVKRLGRPKKATKAS